MRARAIRAILRAGLVAGAATVVAAAGQAAGAGHARAGGGLPAAAGTGPAPAAPAAGGGSDRDLRVTPVVRAYRKASPAVVNISTQTLVRTGLRLFGAGEDPFEDFMPDIFTREVPAVSLGSGFFIHPGGYIVTNAHVVRRAQKITVTLADKTAFEAKVVAANTEVDLAVLKVLEAKGQAPEGRVFRFLPLGRSDDLMIGETVIAIGNPMGLQNTCTTGVLSAVGRELKFSGGLTYSGLIQLDAPINPGNSGGPLLNIAGDLIGVNTAIRADAQGIGFAIPVDSLADDLAKLLDFERLNRVVFGLLVRRHHEPGGDALLVDAVAAGSPAERAGCKVGDRLAALDGRPVRSLVDYQVAMLEAPAGRNVRLAFARAGKTVEATVAVVPRPKPDGAALAKGLFGLDLAVLDAETAKRLHLRVDAGLLVVGVESGSPAERLGLHRNDVVFQIGRWYLTDLDRLGAVLEDVKAGERLRLGIVRGNFRAWTTIEARPQGTGPQRAQPQTTRPAGKVRI